MHSKRVVFPAPFGPIKPRISPGRIEKSTPASAVTSRYRLVRRSTRTHSADPAARAISAVVNYIDLDRRRAPTTSSRNHSEGLRPSDSPTRSLASRFVGSLRSRGLTRALVRRAAPIAPRNLPAGLAVKPPAGGLVPREGID